MVKKKYSKKTAKKVPYKKTATSKASKKPIYMYSSMSSYKAPYSPKTQKAKGIMGGITYILKTHLGINLASFITEPEHYFIGDKSIIDSCIFPAFARPCPIKPKHGFVDSKVVHNAKDLKALWDKMKKHDKDGEIILGPYFKNVKYNAIYVNSGTLSIGKGNDGATSGKGSVSFPVAPTKFKTELRKLSGVNNKDALYLESVYNKDNLYPWPDRWQLVQVRGGPAIKTVANDYVPKKHLVQSVVEPCNDLVKWETEVKKLPPGAVVYGKGHTLASHAAVHCILHKVPFITTHKPIIGEVLEPTENRKRKLPTLSHDFKRGVQAMAQYGKNNGTKYMRNMFLFSLSVLHNWAYLKQSESAGWLLGAASAAFAKIGTALALGENRHCPGKKHNASRDYVYKNALKNGVSHTKLPEAFRNFYNVNWDGAFGGLPWANCAWYSIELWKRIIRIQNGIDRELSNDEIADIMATINRITNLAHNGGWWFNKIAHASDMDEAAKDPGLTAFASAEVYMDLYQEVCNIKKPKKLKPFNPVYSPCRRSKDGRLYWISVGYNFYFKKYSSKTSVEAQITFEDGSKEVKNIKLSKNEDQGLKRKYRTDKKHKGDKLILRALKGDKFVIPGGKVRTIKSTFGKVI